MAKLVFEENFMNREYSLEKETYIGRGRENNLTIPDYAVFAKLSPADQSALYKTLIKVSRNHAKISLNGDGGYFLTDVGSLNTGSSHGTFLNGDRLAAGQKYSLKDGDKIRFATVECAFKTS